MAFELQELHNISVSLTPKLVSSLPYDMHSRYAAQIHDARAAEQVTAPKHAHHKLTHHFIALCKGLNTDGAEQVKELERSDGSRQVQEQCLAALTLHADVQSSQHS